MIMYNKSNLYYVAEDHGIHDAGWFVSYCTEYFPDLVWYRVPITYCCPSDAPMLVDSFKDYVKMVERNNPTNEIDV